MASSYPGAVDALTNPTATDAMNSVTVPHATQHANANDAIEAIQTELGTDPAGASATVKARLDTLDTTVSAKAPLASPTFTGTPAGPTAADGTNTTQLATTAHVYSGLAGKATLVSPSSLMLPMIASNYYSQAPMTGAATVTPSEAVEFAFIFQVARSCTIDRIAINVTVVGTTGAVVRLGIRNFDLTTWKPSTLIVDGGTVDVVSSTGVKEATVSQALTAGTIYAFTATVQGGAGTRPTLTGAINPIPALLESSVNSGVQSAWAKSSVSGALDNTGSFARSFSTMPRIWLRAS